MNPKILAVAKALPAYTQTTEESLPWIQDWAKEQPDRIQEKASRIFKYSQVNRRYSIMDAEEVFRKSSFEQKNDIYIENAIELGEQALRAALEKAGLNPSDLNYLITTSCTGFMIPSVDAYLINRMHLRQDIVRLPVTEMGCVAGVSALIYANDFLRANPGKYAAVLAIESPMSTFQHDDYSMTNIVSMAIFGDGAACAILGPSEELKPSIVDTEMYHFYEAIHMMGYKVRNSGFQMVLDPSVPETIEQHFPAILFPFLEKNQVTLEQLHHFIFHPGGKKIIQLVEGLLHELGKNIEDTKAILSEFGNMSSATILYVLERFLDKAIPKNDLGLMLSFGPGFSAQRILLRWE